MRKLIIHGVVGFAILLSGFSVLNTIDWMSMFRIKQSIQSMEEKIGNLVWQQYKLDKPEIQNDSIVQGVDIVFKKLCIGNNINPASIQIHIVENEEINAFAIPGNKIVVNLGLINACDNNEQLASVLAHELAHVELNHIPKKLIKEFGIALLISVSGTSDASGIIKEISKELSSTAYDRKNEKEADLRAIEYLKNIDIDPVSLIYFLKKVKDSNISWISSHPNTSERIRYIKKAIN